MVREDQLEVTRFLAAIPMLMLYSVSSLLPDVLPVVCFHFSTITSLLPGEAPAFSLCVNCVRQLFLLASTATIQIMASLYHWLEFRMVLT